MGSENRRAHRGHGEKSNALCPPRPLWLIFFAITRVNPEEIKKCLIARWDRAPHYTSMKTFPDHKHTPLGALPSKQRRLRDVIEEIEQEML